MSNKREQADAIIKKHVLFSIGGGLIPIPLVDMAAVTALQVSMLEQLADLYGIGYNRSIAKSFIAALTGSTVAKLGASLIKAIPGIGTILVFSKAALLQAQKNSEVLSLAWSRLESFHEGQQVLCMINELPEPWLTETENKDHSLVEAQGGI